MTPHSILRSDALIFALDEQASQVGSALIEMSDDEYLSADWMPLVTIANAGDALRRIHRHEPRFLIVCAGRERLEELGSLIRSLRALRPALPLLAIAATHDETIERAVRIAGANYYFSLGVAVDEMLLRQTLGSLGPSPPSSRRFALPRIRGRPAARIAPS